MLVTVAFEITVAFDVLLADAVPFDIGFEGTICYTHDPLTKS